jgi:hypothetical protein
MFSAVASIILTMQVSAETPCYVTRPNMCPEEKFTLTIIEPNPTDGRMTILPQEKDSVTDISFRAVHRLHRP